MNRKYFYLMEQMTRANLYRRNEGYNCEDCEDDDHEFITAKPRKKKTDKEVITAKPRGVKVHKIIVDDSCDNKHK